MLVNFSPKLINFVVSSAKCRVTTENMAAGVLDNFAEGDIYIYIYISRERENWYDEISSWLDS